MPVKCQTRSDIPITEYQYADDAAMAQMEISWLPTEPQVEKDLGAVLTQLAEAELHGTLTQLKLFTLYELKAGNDYWGRRFPQMFPRPEFQGMASAFAHTELNVHAKFYRRIDELLGMNTPEFYHSFTQDKVLAERMAFLGACIGDKDDLFSIGAFSLVEGCILYSSFAFLMHFQADGKNMLPNLHAGLTFSVKDENLHADAGAWAYSTLKDEKNLSETAQQKLDAKLVEAAQKIIEHEDYIIDLTFSKGSIKGITSLQLKHFVASRVNLGLEKLGIEPISSVPYNPVADWFYPMISGDTQHDFFYKLGSSYNRNWKLDNFKWGASE